MQFLVYDTNFRCFFDLFICLSTFRYSNHSACVFDYPYDANSKWYFLYIEYLLFVDSAIVFLYENDIENVMDLLDIYYREASLVSTLLTFLSKVIQYRMLSNHLNISLHFKKITISLQL